MHYIRNWPEGLFILLVMVAPLAIAFFCRGFFDFLIALFAGMGIGLALWVAMLVLSCWIYDRRHKNDTIG